MNITKLKPVLFIMDFLTKGHERSIRAKKNILASFLIKGTSIILSLILVPITLNYVSASQYGIWLTLSSVVGWFSFFDIGLTQGLRNKFAAAKASGNDDLAQSYVSTTYAILSIIFFIVWMLFLIINNFLDWAKILKVTDEMRAEVTLLAIVIFSYFCLAFVFKTVATLLTANQQPAKASVIDLSAQVLSIIIISVLVKTTKGSLMKLGVALSVSQIIALVCGNLVFYRGELNRYRPVLSKIRFSLSKDLLNLGVKFFIIQVASIVQFQTANIIIVRNIGSSDVTAYNIVYKYFGVLYMVYNIFLIPFWSASTEAYVKKDIQWIKNGMKRYKVLNLLLVGIGIIMLFFSETIYRLWLGEGTVKIGLLLSFSGFIYYSVIMFGAKYVSFLNSINALQIQFWASFVSPFVFLFFALLFIKHYHVGPSAVFFASILCNINGILLAPIQYYQIVIKNKKGIWIR